MKKKRVQGTIQTFESNLVLVIVLVLESYGLYCTPLSLQFYSFHLSLFQFRRSLPADVLCGSFVTHSFLPRGGKMNA